MVKSIALLVFLIIVSSVPALASWSPWDEAPAKIQTNDEGLTSVPQIFGVSLIRFYQRSISGQLSPNKCNFTPSCSNYSLQSIKKYGAWHGFVMTFDRLQRDHFWAAEGGYEVVGGRFYEPP